MARTAMISRVLLLALAAATPAATADEGVRGELEITAMNGVYENLAAALTPIEQGPVTMVVRSPSHELRVHRNRLVLVEGAEGLVSADFEADVEGWGQLEIELQSAAGSSAFEDRVEVPRQWLKASGRVRLEPAEGGWDVTFVDYVYEKVGIQIRSEASTQVVDTCRTLVSLGFAVLDCDAVRARLARVEVPLPEKGSRFLIRRELLSEAEQEVVDRFAAP